MRAVITLLIVLGLMGCKKAHGPGDRAVRTPQNVEVVDLQVEASETAAAVAYEEAVRTEAGFPTLGTGWTFGGLYRASDPETGVVCYVVNAHPSAISCVVPTTFPTEETL